MADNATPTPTPTFTRVRLSGSAVVHLGWTNGETLCGADRRHGGTRPTLRLADDAVVTCRRCS